MYLNAGSVLQWVDFDELDGIEILMELKNDSALNCKWLCTIFCLFSFLCDFVIIIYA